LGLFFELSMGLSARKEIPGMSWYLRMNPSSGNLHPTEAYAVLPALEWLPGGAGVYHCAPLDHALEQRARRSRATNSGVIGFCVGLTSITWREAWERCGGVHSMISVRQGISMPIPLWANRGGRRGGRRRDLLFFNPKGPIEV
jgi:hypothetical protein